jgi:predicted DNA-binding transcriptional regulator AlpA
MHPHEHQQRKMLNAPAAAAYCGSSASTLAKLRLYGGGPSYVKLGRRVVYDPADLDRWLASHRRTSTSQCVTA